MEARDGEHLLICDDEEGFADGVVRLMRDGDLRRRLARRARQLVEEQYSWPRANSLLESVYERAIAQRGSVMQMGSATGAAARDRLAVDGVEDG